MSQSSLLLPRLNLFGSKLTELSIHAKHAWNESVHQQLKEHDMILTHPRLIGHLTAITFVSYTPRTNEADKVKHSIMIMVSHREPDSDHMLVSVSYTPSKEPGMGGGRRMHREKDFLQVIRSFGPAEYVRADAAFEFEISTADDLWFPLPTTLEGRSERDVFEIRGVRGAKLSHEDDEPPYSFILDRPSGEEVSLQVWLKFQATSVIDCISEAFQKAQAASTELVWSK